MRKKNYKGRCEKQSLDKFTTICKTYDPIQTAYANILVENKDISEVRCNVILDGRRPGGKFCVSVFRQNQEYHIINVHDGAYSPWLHPSRKVGAVCAPRAV